MLPQTFSREFFKFSQHISSKSTCIFSLADLVRIYIHFREFLKNVVFFLNQEECLRDIGLLPVPIENRPQTKAALYKIR